jgi:hypothetical protein
VCVWGGGGAWGGAAPLVCLEAVISSVMAYTGPPPPTGVHQQHGGDGKDAAESGPTGHRGSRGTGNRGAMSGGSARKGVMPLALDALARALPSTQPWPPGLVDDSQQKVHEHQQPGEEVQEGDPPCMREAARGARPRAWRMSHPALPPSALTQRKRAGTERRTCVLEEVVAADGGQVAAQRGKGQTHVKAGSHSSVCRNGGGRHDRGGGGGARGGGGGHTPQELGAWRWAPHRGAEDLCQHPAGSTALPLLKPRPLASQPTPQCRRRPGSAC